MGSKEISEFPPQNHVICLVNYFHTYNEAFLHAMNISASFRLEVR